MIYTKVYIGDDVEIKVPLIDDEFYARCPKCGVERNIEAHVIADIIKDGDDLYSTSIYCNECSKK